MRVLKAVLRLAAITLPPTRRARWQEESLAMLAGVHGARRWWFAADMAVKAPLLAVQVREPAPPPRRWLSVVTGCALIGTSAVAVAALALASVIGEDAAEFLFLTAPAGLLGVVAIRSVRTARSYGGGLLPYLIALLVTVFAGTGPVASGALSVATGTPAVALLGAAVPGLWLLAVNALAMRRRTGPAALSATGLAAGAGLIGTLISVQLMSHVPAAQPAASAASALSLLVLAPTWTVWSVWTGLRLISARQSMV
jgi:hypothetical protein